LFGGWVGQHLTNQTWLYRQGGWVNDTDPTNAPPARSGAAMAYDNQTGVHAVVLFGGCDPTGACPRNDTWLFSAGTWRNVSPTIGPAPTLYNASMTSWGQNGTILYGGCTTNPCGTDSSTTWAFQNTSGCWALHRSPCWTPIATHGTSPPGLANPALADDPSVGPTNGTIVLYGGENRSCGTCLARDSNATWEFNGGSWSNLTSTYTGSSYPGAGRSLAALFWDPTSQALYLYGGFNDSTGVVYDQLWMTGLYAWVNETALPRPTPARFGPAVAGGGSAPGTPMRALLLGGRSPTGSAERDLWVFEPSLVVRPQVDPDPVETNATVGLFSNTSGGTLPGVSWATGDGGTVTGANGTYSYRTPGVYTARATATDFYGVRNVSSVLVTVHRFSLGLVGPTVVDESAAALYSSDPTNGTAPYNFTWTFSDGSTGFGATVSHVFLATGPASLDLAVRDGTGTIVSEPESVHVDPALTGRASVAPAAVDVGGTANLSVSGFGGTPPYESVWTLPEGRTIAGGNATFRPTAAGVANVTVALTDHAGVVWADSLALMVNPLLSFTVSSSSSSPTSGRSVTFSTVLVGGTSPYSYSWRFGDGATSTSPSPTHTYPTPGSYSVNVWVNDSGGGSFRQTVEVKVPRTSGGLLWQILALPVTDLIAITIGIVAAVLVVAALVYRRVPRPRSPAWGPPPPSPSEPSGSETIGSSHP